MPAVIKENKNKTCSNFTHMLNSEWTLTLSCLFLYSLLFVLDQLFYFNSNSLWIGIITILFVLTAYVVKFTRLNGWKRLKDLQHGVIALCLYMNILYVISEGHHKSNWDRKEKDLSINKLIFYFTMNKTCSSFWKYPVWVKITFVLLDLGLILVNNLTYNFTYSTFPLLAIVLYFNARSFGERLANEGRTDKEDASKNIEELKDVLRVARIGRFTVDERSFFVNEDGLMLPRLTSQSSNLNSQLYLLERQSDFIADLSDNTEGCLIKGLAEALIKVPEEFEEVLQSNSNRKSLKYYLNEFVLKEHTEHVDNVYVSIGNFRLANEGKPQVFKVHVKRRCNKKLDLILQEQKVVKEKVYSTQDKTTDLILAKISHEFKGPMMLIQNTIDAILENESKCDKINIQTELLRIKYFAEIILLQILDLNTNYNISRDSLRDHSNSVVEFLNLKRYLVDLSQGYCSIYDKILKIIIAIEESLKYSQVITDDKKLKQVLSNLISNAIKVSSDGAQLVVTFEKKEIATNAPLSRRTSGVIFLNNCLRDESEEAQHKERICTEPNEHIKDIKQSKISVNAELDRLTKDRGFVITIEDSGPGISEYYLKLINGKKTTEQIFTHRRSTEVDDYLLNKGLGTGLLISKKVCLEIEGQMRCECKSENSAYISGMITNNMIYGTRFILSFNNDVETTLDTTIQTACNVNLDLSAKELINDNKIKEEYKAEHDQFKITKEVNTEIISSNMSKLKTTKVSSCSDFGMLSQIKPNTNISNKCKSLAFSSMIRSPKIKPNSSIFLNKTRSMSQFGRREKPILNQLNSDDNIQFYNAENDVNETEENILDKFIKDLNVCDVDSFNLYFVDSVITENPEEERSPTLRPSNDEEVKEGTPRKRRVQSFEKKSTQITNERIRKFSTQEIPIESNSKKSFHSSDEEIPEGDKVLIVDDNGHYAKSLEKLVLRYGKNNNRPIHTKTLSDGIELVYEIYKELTRNDGRLQTKIIFSDQMMVYMNGSEAFTILKNICKDKNVKEIPFVICSAFGDSSHKEKMKGFGLINVYQKPITMGNVEYLMDGILK